MSKVILITGISSGLGESIGRFLSAKGLKVYGICRSDFKPDYEANVIKADVIDTFSIKEAIKQIIEKEKKIDVVINNAGMGYGGPIECFTEEEAKNQFDINFFGTFRVCKEVISYMRENGYGLIINVGSIGGLIGLPYQGFYSATKFAIQGFSEALYQELKPFNVHVVVVNPGDFSTNFTSNRKVIQNVYDTPYRKQFMKTLSIIEKDEKNGLKPEVLAKRIYKIINTKNPKVKYNIASFEQKLAVFLKCLLPSRMFMKMISSHYGIK